MDERLAAAFSVLPHYLGQHVLLSAAALALGILISLPLAVMVAHRPRLRWPILALASLVQTIPGLALLALFYPLLLALSAVTVRLTGAAIPALGFLPSLLALTLYSMLPILRNAVAGLTGVDPDIVEAADGVGMTARQRLWRIEAPLATPVVMAGVRTAAVWTIGAATLSTPVGQASLGNYIFSGLQTENWVDVLFGCAASAGLALVVDQLLGLIETGAARRSTPRLVFGLVGLTLGVAAALAPLAVGHATPYRIGAKNFGEQFILSELIGARIERYGHAVEHKDGLGSAVIFRALASGDIDVYVDYSGTLWANVMGRRDIVARQEMLDEITRFMDRRYGVGVSGSLGFENAYVLAMKRSRAAALGVRTVDDLAGHAAELSLGSDLEFLSRPEWTGLQRAYGLNFRTRTAYNPTFMYRALESDRVDVISAFSSDGRIAAEDLVVLEDTRHALPAYDAVMLVSPKRRHDRILAASLSALPGRISVEHMRQANLMVDRAGDKRSPKEAAVWLAKASGPK